MPLWNKVKDFFTGFQQGSVHLPFIQPQEDKDVLIIDRKTWSRGRPSALLSHTGRCCQGFYAQSLGVPDDQMMDIGNPCRLPYGCTNWQKIKESWLTDHNMTDTIGRKYELWVSADNLSLVRYNDCEVGKKPYAEEEIMTEEIRERKIAEVFARNGVRVQFKN
jgi:hypothetical protein